MRAVIILLAGLHGVLAAQTPAVPRSDLLGVDLPATAQPDRGMLVRAAARATLGLKSGDAGVSLADGVEVFRLPRGDSATSAAALFGSFERRGLQVRRVANDSATAVVTREGTRHLVHWAVDRRTGWLYIGAAAAAVASPGEVARATPLPTAAVPAVASAAATAPPAPTPAPRFQLTSTTYRDGWSATEQADHVRLANGPLSGWIWHRVPITDAMRTGSRDLVDIFWARDVASRYTVVSTDDRVAETRFTTLEYREGAVRTASGAPAYVGLYVVVEQGTAQSLVLEAPDQATFRQTFPTPESMAPLQRMNRFGVAASDLPGTWTSSGGAYVAMYYVTSGLYAGTDGASLADTFTFFADGTYTSRHTGASGTVGRQRPFTQRYQGRWQLTGIWELVLTNRYGGATETYAVSFSSVTGGRVLHLVNTARGVDAYDLGRTP